MERLGVCVDCKEVIEQVGKRGRLPERCPKCRKQRLKSYGRPKLVNSESPTAVSQ
jgi:phage FluMu protein Com